MLWTEFAPSVGPNFSAHLLSSLLFYVSKCHYWEKPIILAVLFHFTVSCILFQIIKGNQAKITQLILTYQNLNEKCDWKWTAQLHSTIFLAVIKYVDRSIQCFRGYSWWINGRAIIGGLAGQTLYSNCKPNASSNTCCCDATNSTICWAFNSF